MSLIAIVSILVLLLIIVVLFLFHLEQVKYTKRLEGRISVLSSRIQSMKNKELDTVLKSIEYKKERDELYRLLEEGYNRPDFGKRQGHNLPHSSHLYEPNKLYTSYYTQSFSQSDTQTDTQTDNQSDNSSSYTGGGGDFSGGGSGGSWD